MNRAAAFLIGFVGLLPPVVEVDRLERNHVIELDGREQLDQVIAWDFCPVRGDFCCRGWVLTERCEPPAPTARGQQVAWPLPNGGLRHVRARSACETWTFFDPEVRDRDYLPIERRGRFP